MGAVMRRHEVNGRELHFSTGKLLPEGQMHEPEWSEWMPEGPVMMRQCRNKDCDLDDYKSYED